MSKKEGAKPKLLRYFLENLGREIPRQELAELCKDNGTEWPRSLRSLKGDDGWDIQTINNGKAYKLRSDKPKTTSKRRIAQTLRAMVLLRDNSTCQMCGKNVQKDCIKIQVDHIIPFSWGGQTVIENLQCLCEECNAGKKNWEAGEDPILMTEINKAASTEKRLELYFRFYPNTEIPVRKLSVIGRTREWTRSIRKIRETKKMNIVALRKKKGVRNEDAYIFYED